MTFVGFKIDDKVWKLLTAGTHRDVRLVDSTVYILEQYILANYSTTDNKMKSMITKELIAKSREDIVKVIA